MPFQVDGLVGRQVQRLAASPGFRKVAPKVVPPIDKVLSTVSGGRFLLSQLLVPSLLLTTTGRKSGEPRRAPLACLPEDDGSFLVVGSNFGREHHPAWTSNLLALPAATVTYAGRTQDVVAHLLDEAEKAAVWPRLSEIWPTYDRYVASSGRDLRVFRLVPVG